MSLQNSFEKFIRAEEAFYETLLKKEVNVVEVLSAHHNCITALHRFLVAGEEPSE